MLLRRRHKKNYAKHKELARAVVHERVAKLNTHYQVPLRRIAIKNHKSRWGSASEKGNLNFNYKIIFLPPELQEYIVAHELCHLKIFNHSPSFWALVEQTVPNHRELRGQLRGLERSKS